MKTDSCGGPVSGLDSRAGRNRGVMLRMSWMVQADERGLHGASQGGRRHHAVAKRHYRYGASVGLLAPDLAGPPDGLERDDGRS